MRNNISEELKEVLIEFRKLSDENKLYTISVLLNHLSNGLINDGNYSDVDDAYENDKSVLTNLDINLDDPMKLATDLLIISSTKEDITINPNGIDIEPYVNKNSKLEIRTIVSKFYRLDFKDKIDFFIETLYDISEIKEVQKMDFDFNGLIDELLTYSKMKIGENNENNLEIETTN